MDYQNFLISKLKLASEIALSYFGKVTSTTKGEDNNQVLTEADLAVGKYLVEQIKSEFPTYNIIDEETGVINYNSNFTWVVDPIDGTSNFANGLPHYGVMLGLLENDTAIAGGIALPAYSEIYIAEKGKGAYCNGEKINTTISTELLTQLIAYGIDGHQENPQITREELKILENIILKIRNLRMSNSAFDIAMVAKGKYGACLNRTSKIWDNVAQQVLIEEAGGTYTDFWGKKIDYTNALNKVQENFTFCAGAPQLHKQLQNLIHNNA